MTAGYITIEAGCVDPPGGGRPTVSVIVPIYNVERYLDQALGSVEAQTLRDIEIICVNDGSTDGSGRIMEAHAAADSRIRVIDKPNGGYGQAMNRGIAEAHGIWVAILEPDDWIEPRMLEDLTRYAASFDEPVDIVKSPYWRIWRPDTPRQRKMRCSYAGRVKPRRQPFKITDPGATHLLRHHPSIWSALYRRSFLGEFGIRFPELPGASWADNPFLAETMGQARAIAYLDRAYYCYREDTPEKEAALAKRSPLLPLERWHDIKDVYERIGLRDESIERVQAICGFVHADRLVDSQALPRDEEDAALLGMFERMEDGLVFSDPEISPAWKRRYAELKGVGLPSIPSAPYRKKLVVNGLYNLRNTGIAPTAHALGVRLSRLRGSQARQGGEPPAAE